MRRLFKGMLVKNQDNIIAARQLFIKHPRCMQTSKVIEGKVTRNVGGLLLWGMKPVSTEDILLLRVSYHVIVRILQFKKTYPFLHLVVSGIVPNPQRTSLLPHNVCSLLGYLTLLSDDLVPKRMQVRGVAHIHAHCHI